MSISILKKLTAAAVVLLLTWVVYVYRQVPHSQAPFAKAIEQGHEIILQQDLKKVGFMKEAGHWKVGNASGSPYYPVEESLMTPLVSGLKNLQLEDEITDRADRASDYDVTPQKGTTVSVLGPKGSNIGVVGLFGKQAPDMAHLYFRFTDKPNVYLARGLFRGDLGHLEMNYWRNRGLIDIPETKIQSILIEGKGLKTALVRVSTEVWTLNGSPVDPTPVNALVGVLAHLRAEDFIDPAADPKLTPDGLTFARVTIQGADSSTELRFGPQDAKTKRYPVAISNTASLAWLSEASANSILKKPSDFKGKK